MNILEITINDVKRISAVSINPQSGEPVILTGDNANGKSSVLDAIVLALTNKGLDDPIRHGAQSGEVKIKLGADGVEYTVTRKVTKRGDSLVIVGPDGCSVPKAQTFLNGLLGNYAFDPLAFTKLKAKEQVEALKDAAGLDFTALDEEHAKLFATRTEIGRRGKEVGGAFANLPMPLPGTPDEEVSASALMAELQGMTAQVTRHKEREGKLREIIAVSDQIAERIRLDQMKLAEIRKTIEEVELEMQAIELPSADQIEAANKAVSELDETNAAVREKRKWNELKVETESLREQYADLTKQLTAIDEEKAERVQKANMPLDGLELTADGVIFNGTLFNQLSTAEQIRISTLVAMSQNPELKIILVREGALLNRANLSMMADLAKERGQQLWIEVFDEDPRENSLHITDGKISHVNGQEVQP